MKKWLRRKLQNFLAGNEATIGRDNGQLPGPTLTLRVTHAIGGTVITTYIYNEAKGQSKESMNVIHSDENLATCLDAIIMRESLRS